MVYPSGAARGQVGTAPAPPSINEVQCLAGCYGRGASAPPTIIYDKPMLASLARSEVERLQPIRISMKLRERVAVTGHRRR